jgi:hypothetical protein
LATAENTGGERELRVGRGEPSIALGDDRQHHCEFMTSAPTPAVRTSARRQWPRWLVYAGWTVLAIIVVGAAGTIFTVQFGGVHGVELNPYSFARRSYSFYEVPIVRWQVRGIRREDVTSVVVDFLEKEKYLPATKAAPDVWHIVVGSRGVSGPQPRKAEILVHYLETTTAENNHLWVEWSEKNPKLAGPLWKAVSRLAQDELYEYIPDLFDMAQMASDPVQFQKQLDAELSTRLLDLGLRLQELDEHAEAKKYLAEAAQLDPANPTIKRALEKSSALDDGQATPKS